MLYLTFEKSKRVVNNNYNFPLNFKLFSSDNVFSLMSNIMHLFWDMSLLAKIFLKELFSASRRYKVLNIAQMRFTYMEFNLFCIGSKTLILFFIAANFVPTMPLILPCPKRNSLFKMTKEMTIDD